MNIIGRQNYDLNFTNLRSEINVEGKFSVIYNQSLWSYKELTLSKDSIVNFSVFFSIHKDVHFIQANVLTGADMQFKETRSDKYGKILVLVSLNMKISQVVNISKVFSLSSITSKTKPYI